MVNCALMCDDSERIPLTWILGFTYQAESLPTEFIPAQVPGAVQLDWAAAKAWPAIEYQADYPVRYEVRNVPIAADYEWMEDVYWLYRTQLDFQPLEAGQRLFIVCGGVDYHCQVKINGQIIHVQEGMFTPFEIDLTDQVYPGEILEILVFPVPKIYRQPVDEKQSNQSCKPAFSYGWDFHPRLIPLGI